MRVSRTDASPKAAACSRLSMDEACQIRVPSSDPIAYVTAIANSPPATLRTTARPGGP